ncbi:MAG: tRNA (guanosine(46)-N7)-methyltransferase TrmB [Methyloversatilis discipulorum]|uniref:tRNA (guanosine(46)-N7)-methyltransferase TrmB n=1 Tax=Methyloversatilis discipulorum TaxID=1119528 RepID=UPI0026EB4198|nr:tRNA (guanosine(46)-N7)-methyltransferase TrmB [Methyloversatilis discipulorum]MBV5287782.1 tRNA (guanosine(46)-N7)-methyltransferase TrmB [Methyloversatilis discipulorum]
MNDDNTPDTSEGADDTRPQRHIRSYVLRQGRMSPAQVRNIEEGMPRWGIPHAPQAIDYAATFGRTAPVVLEIGFGMGFTTAEIAAARPDTDFIGIEVHGPGVGNMFKLIAEQQLANVRVIQHDAVEVLRDMIPDDSLAGVHVYFPDPWPKKRHLKRRLIQSPLVAQLAAKLAPGGYLHCATDIEDYGQQMLDVLSAEPLLENTADGFAPRPDYRPLTKFEARGLRLGHGVWDVIFRRRG